MNILYIAYSCAPDHGSEDKIGWNIPLASAANNRVFVITKEEHRQSIEAYCAENRIGNISFYYVDIPHIYKKILKKGATYSARLNIWHRRALPLAKRICAETQIDIIHQITPIEFRSIGDYWKIPNVKFICGPLGGGEYIPNGLWGYARRHFLVEGIRALLNEGVRLKYRFTGVLKKCDYILFANRETRDYLSNLPGCERHLLCSEIGIGKDDFSTAVQSGIQKSGCCNFFMAGRFAYRKGHDFLLDAIRQIPKELEYRCRLAGDGPEYHRLQNCCREEGLSEKVVFLGKIPYGQMCEEYRQADVFVMPSLRETTGSVLLEAMAQGLPVITTNRFGGAVILDASSAWLFDGTDRESYIESLKDAMVDCICNYESVAARGKKAMDVASEYTWEKKAACYEAIYRRVMEQTK